MGSFIRLIINRCCLLLLSGLLAGLCPNDAAPSDTTTVRALIEASKSLRNSNADSALVLAREALTTAQELQNIGWLIRTHNQLGILNRYRGELGQAAGHYRASLALAVATGDSSGMAQAWHNLGVISRKQGALTEALEFELRSLPLFERTGDSVALGHAYNSLGNIYSQQENWSDALANYQQGLAIQRGVNNRAGEARMLYNLGVTHFRKRDLHRADSLLGLSLIIATELNNRRSMANCRHSLGIIQQELGNSELAQGHYMAGLALQQEMKDREGELYTLMSLGELAIEQGKYARAEGFLREALPLANTMKLREEQQQVHQSLARTLEIQGQPAMAMHHLRQHQQIKDSLREEATSHRLLELQEKYETEKKEQENQLLLETNDLKEQQLASQTEALWFRKAVIVVLLVVLLLTGLLLIAYRQRLRTDRLVAQQRQELDHQRMEELMREQEVAFLDATLQGQEGERQRIAADLHDGLNNLLVAIKLQFENQMDDLFPNPSPEAEHFQQSVDLLDQACHEVRSIAHNLTIEESGFQLKPALIQLVNTVKQTGQLNTELSIHGLDFPLGKAVEAEVFHALRELLGNCLKHADAKRLSIQVTQHENSLNILVEDDGSGFDLNQSRNGGMGLKNMAQRIEKLNGTLVIDTATGRGTATSIDIPISSSS